MLENIKVLCHSSILFEKEKVIYFDPFKLEGNLSKADVIFITHDHYDHYSEEDIKKVIKDNTIIVVPKSLEKQVKKLGFDSNYTIIVEPNKKYEVLGISFETIPAYNINKKFHPKENKWVGYIIEIQNIRYYIAGDTDITEENKNVKCDVAFVPIGGTYTMNYKEAAEFVNIIKPKIAVPIHYETIVGTKEDAINFSKLISSEIKCEVLIK